ncbi:MAG: hypothetical protein KA807_09100 [Prolixibacteraceae bacterium]|nr:hypothetical protein [Prolixibacteraceae bacterium]
MVIIKKIFVSIILILNILVVQGQVEISLLQQPLIDIIESPLISEVSFTPLQITKIGMISQDMEMKYYDNNYFILDNKFTQSVYRFDEEGILLNTITAQDTSLQSSNKLVLTNPAKFNINHFNKLVELYNFEESAIQRFTYEGKKLDKIKLALNPSDFTRTKEGNYLIYTGWNNKETQYRLLIADRSGKTTDKKLRLVTKCTPTEGYSFYTTDDGTYMWELLGNTTYLISNNNNITEKFVFNYGNKNLLPNYHMLEAYDSYRLINHAGYYTIKKYLENKDFAYFFLNFTGENQKEMYHIIYDKNKKITYSYNENAGIGAFDKAQALTDNNELIFLVAPRKFRQLFNSGIENISPVFDELSGIVNKERNPIILKIKLQSI